jgi:Transketolase, C-terminal domain
MLTERDLELKSVQYRKAVLRLIKACGPATPAAISPASTSSTCCRWPRGSRWRAKWIAKIIESIHGVITVEEHSVNGGLGEACASLLLQEAISSGFKIAGFPDDHTVSGSQEEILHHYGLDGAGLVLAGRNLLAKR